MLKHLSDRCGARDDLLADYRRRPFGCTEGRDRMSVRQCLTNLRIKGGFLALVLMVVFLVWPGLTPAHHSFASQLTPEGEEAIEVLDGTVRVFRILNPHGALVVNVPNENGEEEGWLFELSPAAQLAREGWAEDILQPGDSVRVAAQLSTTPNRARLRALLIHGKSEDEAARLLVSYGIRGDTPTMIRLRERLPICGTIDQSYNRTECFLIDDQAMTALNDEFPGEMGYVLP